MLSVFLSYFLLELHKARGSPVPLTGLELGPSSSGTTESLTTGQPGNRPAPAGCTWGASWTALCPCQGCAGQGMSQDQPMLPMESRGRGKVHDCCRRREAPGELRGCYLAVPERAGQGPEASAAGRGVGGLGGHRPSEGTASCVRDPEGLRVRPGDGQSACRVWGRPWAGDGFPRQISHVRGGARAWSHIRKGRDSLEPPASSGSGVRSLLRGAGCCCVALRPGCGRHSPTGSPHWLCVPQSHLERNQVPSSPRAALLPHR